MNLIELKNDVETAKEILSQTEAAYEKGVAEAAYEKGVAEAVRSGKLVERETGTWVEKYVDDKVKVYCDHCKAYSPVKSRFCPSCGALMTNPQYCPEKTAEEPKSSRTKDEWDLMTTPQKQEACRNMLDALVKHYGTILGANKAIGSAGFCDNFRKTEVPRYSTYIKILNAYEKVQN